MATIKSYTSLEQSRKLADILPLESADMKILPFTEREYRIVPINDISVCGREDEIYAWSLAALLNILPNEIISNNMFECHYQIDIRKYDGGNNTTLYQIAYGNNSGFSGSWHDMINTGEKESLIDCCVQMIIKLHEFKKL
jgi:hypothetical protein